MKNWTLFLMLVIGIVVTGSVGADEKKAEEKKPDAVEIPDAALRTVLLETMKNRPKDRTDITKEDLRNVWFLNAEDRGITSLAGLEHCSNLGEARLGRNQIQDISPLAKCSSLQSLSLQHNEITDVAPLGALSKLQYLNIEHNKVASIGGLSSLQALTSLYASHNQIESLEGVEQLNRLWTLSVNHNLISHLAPIAGLKRLQSLGLAHNKIEDVSALPPGNTIYSTYLQGNQIKDIAPLAKLAETDAAEGKRFAAFWNLYLADNPLSDDSRKTHLETLKSHGVRLNLDYDK